MPDHQRKTIRDQLGDDIDNLTTTSTRAYVGQETKVDSANLPALLIDEFEEESVAETTTEPRVLTRRLKLNIHAIISNTATNYVDTLDLIAKEVEVALGDDATLNGKADNARLTSTRLRHRLDKDEDRLIFGVIDTGSGDAVQAYAILTMVWTIDYRTAENAPDTKL